MKTSLAIANDLISIIIAAAAAVVDPIYTVQNLFDEFIFHTFLHLN